MSQSLKIWGEGACSNAARRRFLAAPSDPPKYGGAAAPPLPTCLLVNKLVLQGASIAKLNLLTQAKATMT